MSTIKDVAALAGVSTATVSRVINRDTTYKMTDATREKVWQAVAELNYKASATPRKLRHTTQDNTQIKRIGCILSVTRGKYNDPYYLSILSSFEEQIMKRNCVMAFVRGSTELDNPEILARTLDEDLDGLILMNTLTESTFSTLASRIPYIVGIDTRHPTIDNIGYDHYDCSAMAIHHLISLGYRDIGFVGGSEAFKNESRRFRGYIAAMYAAGLQINPDWIFFSEWDDEYLIRLIEDAYRKKKLPRAIFASSDLMAMAVLRSLYNLHVSVPEEVAVMGLTNLEMSKYSNPPLTTIDLPTTAMGSVAADVLLSRMQGDTSIPKEILLPVSLVRRDSV